MYILEELKHRKDIERVRLDKEITLKLVEE